MGTQYSPKIVTDGLVLCVDAANPKSYSGSGTSWNDISGNGNDAILQNGVIFDSLNNGSFVFDGTDTIAQTSYNEPLNDFTIFAWFYYASGSNNNNYNIIVDKEFTTGTYLGADDTGQNKWGGGVIEPAPPYGRFITLLPDRWNMIVSRRSIGVTQAVHTIYGNGISNKILGIVSSDPLNSISFAFGNYTFGHVYGPGLDGKISLIQIYNRALSDSEILQNFNTLRGRYGI